MLTLIYQSCILVKKFGMMAAQNLPSLQRASYARRASRQLPLGSGSLDGMGSLEEAEKMQEMHEFVEDAMGKEEDGFGNDVSRNENNYRQMIKRKIIERKYFKQPQETNMLTWDAKEQIRYLNAEFPDEWTIDRLAESFPVSREGIVRLLKSTYRPRTIDEVMRHDLRVQKNWLAVQKPVMLRYEMTGPDGAQRMLNAAGNPQLPMGKMENLRSQTSLEVQKNDRRGRQLKAPGTFESIVKKYCEKKLLAAGAAKEQKQLETTKKPTSEMKMLTEHVAKNRLVLQNIVSRPNTDQFDTALPRNNKKASLHKKDSKSSGGVSKR